MDGWKNWFWSEHGISYNTSLVPKDKARIRAQISAAHSRDDLEMALNAFAKVKAELGV